MMVGAMSLAGATVASAANFSFIGGTVDNMATIATDFPKGADFKDGGPGRIAASDFLSAIAPTDVADTDIQIYNQSKTGSEGLNLNTFNGGNNTARIRFTYFGSFATFDNFALLINGTETELFNNETSQIGDTVVVSFTDFNGLLPFVFRTTRFDGDLEAQNDGTIDPGLWLAYARTDNDPENTTAGNVPFYTNAFGLQSTIAFFGDGGGDDVGRSDYNDLVVGIGVVPVPPAVVFLLTAIAGLGVVRSRRSKVNA